MGSHMTCKLGAAGSCSNLRCFYSHALGNGGPVLPCVSEQGIEARLSSAHPTWRAGEGLGHGGRQQGAGPAG